MMRISDTVKHLIIINVVVFIGTVAIMNGVFYDWFSMCFPKNEAFKPWQIFTYMFMHGGGDVNNLSITHLLFNMLGLWMFGSAVEHVLGAKRFLFLYISAGLGAVLFQVGYYYFNYIPTFSELESSGISSNLIIDIMETGKWNFQTSDIQEAQINELYHIYNASMVGASGCIMGVMAAFGMMNPNAELMMIFLPIPIKAKYFIPGIIIIDLISGFRGQSIFGYGNIAHFAHVGGALTGFLIMWYWKKTQFNKNRWN